MAPHSSAPAWKIPWTEEPGGLQSMGLQRVRHDLATNTSLQDLAIPQHTEVTAAPPSEGSPTWHCARV